MSLQNCHARACLQHGPRGLVRGLEAIRGMLACFFAWLLLLAREDLPSQRCTGAALQVLVWSK